MGKLKAVLMAKTEDDMGADEHPELFHDIKGNYELQGDIPDEVYREAGLSLYSATELLNELGKRIREYER